MPVILENNLLLRLLVKLLGKSWNQFMMKNLNLNNLSSFQNICATTLATYAQDSMEDQSDIFSLSV